MMTAGVYKDDVEDDVKWRRFKTREADRKIVVRR